jgi:minichromosome maintenance protein 10
MSMPAAAPEDDDDEETLQLQLQAIEARLRLKKLQKQQQQLHTAHDDAQDSHSPRKRQKTQHAGPAVQVSYSPVKDHMPPPRPPGPTSPARVLLGIDKGLRASDISLKRARNGTTLTNKSAPPPQPKLSFSDRIAASRLSTEQQQVKHDRIEKARSQGFGLNPPKPPLSRTHSDTTTTLVSTQTTSTTFTRSIPTSSASHNPFVSQRAPQSAASSSSDKARGHTESDTDASCFESFSSLHLSRRIIPHTTLARALDSKQIYTLPRLLKEVKAPVYEPPDCESDFVVLAVIASKSTPHDTRPKYKQTSSTADENYDAAGKSKFMVMTLTDLKWEVDLFLFDTAFEAFWKMTPGTVVAMLNPTIMPPKTNEHSGKFSLKLASSEDSVMEIGAARDLGFCTALKKTGQECGSWVNARKNKFCDYHVELAVGKSRASRMEVNSMYRPNSQHQKNARVLREGEFARRQDPARRDAESNERYYMVPGSRSAATLLDQDDFGKADALRRRLKDKEKDRALAEKLGQMGNGIGAEYLQRTTGTHVSSDNQHSSTSHTNDAPPPKLTAAELGLVNKNAADIRLSPAKNRRKLFSVLPGGSKTTAAGPEAMGWGGNARRGLGGNNDSRRRDGGGLGSPEKGQTRLEVVSKQTSSKVSSSLSSRRVTVAASTSSTTTSRGEKSPTKRARFQLAKGIREPGRESLGGDGNVDNDDDSDDLEIY